MDSSDLMESESQSESESDARTNSSSNSNDAAEPAVPASVLEDADSEDGGGVAVLCLGLFALSLGLATPVLSVQSTPLHQPTTSPTAINMADRFPSLEDFSEGTAATIPCSV